MHTLSVSVDGMELTASGASGIYTWRVSTQSSEAGTRAVLMPLPARLHPPPEHADYDPHSVQLTCLIHLTPALSLAGDSAGLLTLWAPPGVAASPIAAFDLSSSFEEVDLVHATAAGPTDANGQPTAWLLIVGGVSAAGSAPSLCRYQLSLPTLDEANAAAKDGSAELEVRHHHHYPL